MHSSCRLPHSLLATRCSAFNRRNTHTCYAILQYEGRGTRHDTASGNQSSLWPALLEAAAVKLNDLTSLAEGGQRRLLAGLTPPPPGFPAGPMGENAVSLVSNPLQFLARMSDEYGGVFSVVVAGERLLVVSDAHLAREVLIEKQHIFGKDGTALMPGSSLTGNGLLTSDGEIWKRQRKLTNPAFRKAAIANYAQVMSDHSVELFDGAWCRGGAIEVYGGFNELTLQISMQLLFGSSMEGHTARQVSDAIKVAFTYFSGRQGSSLPLPEWLPTPDNINFRGIVSDLDDIVYGIINNRRKKLSNTTTKQPQDLLDTLLLSCDDEGEMSSQAVRDELMTLMVASQETSAIVLGWTCALLAHHPTWHRRVASEVREGLQGRPPTLQDISGMRSLECSVLEALRLLPPAYIVGRCARHDVTLGQYTLNKGTTVLVSPYLMHRNQSIWPKANHFQPQRWEEPLSSCSSGSSMLPSMSLMSDMGPNGSYLPFGAGPRNCIGTGFAMIELMLIMANLLQRFDISPLPGASFPQPNAVITLRPAAVPLMLKPVTRHSTHAHKTVAASVSESAYDIKTAAAAAAVAAT